MSDEVDTTTRWRCPACGEVIEADYALLQITVLSHQRRCKEKNDDVKKG